MKAPAHRRSMSCVNYLNLSMFQIPLTSVALPQQTLLHNNGTRVQCPHYMSDAQDIVVSQEKFDEMIKELEHLKTVRRTEIAKNLEYARSLGDLSENAEY